MDVLHDQLSKVKDDHGQSTKRAHKHEDDELSKKKKMSLNPEEAQRDRGYYEVEVGINGEADLHQHYNNCIKNPGHLKFIPVKKFTMQHLPEDYRDRNILDMVKAFSDLAVRVLVRHVSQGRPDSWPDSNDPYPFSNCRDSDMLRTGSGWVQWVCRRKNVSCRCSECMNSKTPAMEWGFIAVNTAAHVVFDSKEAKHTTIELFYDSDQDRGSVCSLSEAFNGFFNVKEDRSALPFATHDKNLLDSLEKLCYHRNQLQKGISYMYKSSDSLVNRLMAAFLMRGNLSALIEGPIMGEGDRKLTIIVSHPHGCSKQITVGEWTYREEFEGDTATHTRYTYTTSTCPGSSGALVYIFGDKSIPMYRYNNHAHSRRCEEEGLNMCGGGFDD